MNGEGGTIPNATNGNTATGMDQNAASQSTAQEQQPGATPPPQPPEQKPAVKVRDVRRLFRIMLVTVIVIVAALVGSLYVLGKLTTTTTTISPNTISSTTTIKSLSFTQISACGTVSKPGLYNVSSISTSIQQGSCIRVNASNVLLNCRGSKITGSGPLVDVPPFSSGILVSRQANVSVINCDIGNFSYGVYASDASNLKLNNDTLAQNYMANIYFSSVSGSTISNDSLSRSSSIQGSIDITTNSIDNYVYNNTVQNNAFYGIVINSSNNRFVKNYVNTSRIAFSCSLGSGAPKSNIGTSNLCYNDTGCDFLSCKGTDLPVAVSNITLSSRINSCGSIVSSGSYALDSDIDMHSYANISNPLLVTLQIPCINVAADNVAINCNNHTISNASFGILASGVQNLTIENCKISSSAFGIKFIGVSLSNINSTTATGDNVSVEFVNSHNNAANVLSTMGGHTGLLLSGSPGNKFSAFNISHDYYGIYLTGSLGNYFANGYAHNATSVDVYATPDSTGSVTNIMLSTSCGITNANWSTCASHYYPPTAYIPVSACGVIANSGNYSLILDVLQAQGTCIKVEANNVYLSCTNHTVHAAYNIAGSGFLISDQHNVTLNGCTAVGFATGINISSSVSVNVYNALIKNSSIGIIASTGTGLQLLNNTVFEASTYGIRLANVSDSTIMDNNVSYGGASSTAISLIDSTKNRVQNNTLASNLDGIAFSGRSQHNTVSNNTAQLNTGMDYLCSASNGGMAAEQGGINYGTSKSGCLWLAALQKGVAQVACASISTPSLPSIHLDALYSYGTTCFSIAANSTTIDCNGHTIIATGGGTFARVQKTHGVTIEDCNLKGFATAVGSDGSAQVSIINSTIYGANQLSSNGIVLNNASYPYINGDTFSNLSTAVYLSDASSGSLTNNRANNVTNAYLLYNSIGLIITNNNATGATYGLILTNSFFNTLKNNVLLSHSSGITCDAASGTSLNNTDYGGNICTNNFGCTWIASSSSSCH